MKPKKDKKSKSVRICNSSKGLQHKILKDQKGAILELFLSNKNKFRLSNLSFL